MKHEFVCFDDTCREKVANFIKELQGNSDEEKIKSLATYNFRRQDTTNDKKYTCYEKYDDKDSSIVDFKKYKNRSRLGSGFDADCCDLVMCIYCCLLECGNCYDIQYKGRIIKFKTPDNNDVQAETDTLNSLERPLNTFIRSVFKKSKTAWHVQWSNDYNSSDNTDDSKDWCMDYKSKYNKVSSIPKKSTKLLLLRDRWLIKDYENFPELKSEQYTLDKLETFARYVHTLGNFWIGPKGFNKFKGSRYRDSAPKFLNMLSTLPKDSTMSSQFNVLWDYEYFENHLENSKKYSFDYQNDEDLQAIMERGKRMATALISHIKQYTIKKGTVPSSYNDNITKE